MTDAQTIEQLTAENKLLLEQNSTLKHELDTLKRLIFGSRSERFKPVMYNPDQLSLFEPEQQPEPVEIPKEKITYERKKKHPGRNAIPDHLPVREEIIEPDIDTAGMIKIGEEITETLEYTPASLVRHRIIRPKYVHKETSEIHIATLPERPLPKAIAEATLLAHILVSKYIDHLPLYRQTKIFSRDFGYIVAQSTVVDWVARVCELLMPLYEALGRSVLESSYIQVDESPIKVLAQKEETGKSPPKNIFQGYMWVYHAPRSEQVWFNYRKGRGMNGPKEVLCDYAGHLQCDGYTVYDDIAAKRDEITLLGCLVHARRYFDQARDSDDERSAYALSLFGEIYRHERELKEKPTLEERQQIRTRHTMPLLNTLYQWARYEYDKVLPKSPIAKAVSYLHRQWPKIERAAQDARFEMDNNLIENKIRPLALGRKNYLFAGSHDGAVRAAMMYSFFGTCKAKGINPYDWLVDTLNKIPSHPINRIQDLLPGYIQINDV